MLWLDCLWADIDDFGNAVLEKNPMAPAALPGRKSRALQNKAQIIERYILVRTAL
jgi:hypothetical protein